VSKRQNNETEGTLNFVVPLKHLDNPELENKLLKRGVTTLSFPNLPASVLELAAHKAMCCLQADAAADRMEKIFDVYGERFEAYSRAREKGFLSEYPEISESYFGDLLFLAVDHETWFTGEEAEAIFDQLIAFLMKARTEDGDDTQLQRIVNDPGALSILYWNLSERFAVTAFNKACRLLDTL